MPVVFPVQESDDVSAKKNLNLPDDKKIQVAVEKILRDIKEVEDPDELNWYRRTVARKVPIFMRGYFTAYLFKQVLGSIPGGTENFTTLFVSTGKNHRIYPKDILGFFMNNLRLQPSEFGEIKVLDNYSFVEISLDHASTAISKLTGKRLRGRKITVNLARKKGENKS